MLKIPDSWLQILSDYGEEINSYIEQREIMKLERFCETTLRDEDFYAGLIALMVTEGRMSLLWELGFADGNRITIITKGANLPYLKLTAPIIVDELHRDKILNAILQQAVKDSDGPGKKLLYSALKLKDFIAWGDDEIQVFWQDGVYTKPVMIKTRGLIE